MYGEAVASYDAALDIAPNHPLILRGKAVTFAKSARLLRVLKVNPTLIKPIFEESQRLHLRAQDASAA